MSDCALDYEQKHAEWEAARSDPLVTEPFLYRKGVLGMPGIIEASLAEHLETASRDGFIYNETPDFRSFMEVVYIEKLRDSDNAWELMHNVITQLNGVLEQVVVASEPKEGKSNLLVIASTEHILPFAKLLRILSHPLSTSSDVDMVWDLFEKLWCLGHPKGYHSGHLLLLEDEINTRFDDLEDEPEATVVKTAVCITDHFR